MTSTTPFNPVADSQATFRVALNALSRPGTVREIPARDPRCPLEEVRPLAALAQTLLDHEVTFAITSDFPQASIVASYLTTTTGSHAVAAAEADYMFARAPLTPGLLTSLKRGSLAFPDESATLVILTEPFDTAGCAVILRGPGIAGELTCTLPGITAANLDERQQANAERPRGIDLLLIDPSGQLIGLPRSTVITQAQAEGGE